MTAVNINSEGWGIGDVFKAKNSAKFTHYLVYRPRERFVKKNIKLPEWIATIGTDAFLMESQAGRISAPPPHVSALEARDGTWTAIVGVYAGKIEEIAIWAKSEALVRDVMDKLRKIYVGRRIPRVSVKQDSHLVRFAFWLHNGQQPKSYSRYIHVPWWEEIQKNYPRDLQDELTKLVGLNAQDDDDPTGRILLMHGPAGTGKTTLIRSLAYQWREWADFECVIDPERLWTDPSYLFSITLGDTGESFLSMLSDEGERTQKGRWKVMVMEDAGELLSAKNTGESSGQALSRLLNMADGILGQGQRVLYIITTNDPIAKLHPAVARPGRCLAQLRMDALSPEESSKWLGRSVSKGYTLAELYALKSGAEAEGEQESGGLYL